MWVLLEGMRGNLARVMVAGVRNRVGYRKLLLISKPLLFKEKVLYREACLVLLG